ncbi:MAG TPA: BTAD domain-containing putative transcriptional regulator [Actinospica sp.]|nr:BTAD domain-containing putative transcriptional regulator [Actinospica sp.]
MRFALLGPVQVHGDEGPVEIRGTLRRTLLAALLLHHDAVVSADRLSDMIWGERPPSSTTTSLYNQIMRLRQALGPDAERIQAVAPGYLIHVEPDELDLDEFSRLCAQGRQAAAEADWARSAARYAAALGLWRGEMLVDVPTLLDHASVHHFAEDRLLALQGRIEADLNLGRHDELIGELRTLAVSHQLREAFHAQLMLALYRAGRQADALAVYRDLRRATVDELGVEPGAAVQALHADILDSAASLSLPKQGPAGAAATGSPTPPRHAPRQLPVDARLFAGRSAELDELVGLAESTDGEAGMFVISAINGMAGIGKTALAVRSGHRLAERFPDGQLFIDLRGYDAELAPLGPEDALDYLLRSLGVEPRAIPADPNERAALYRSRLAGTRTMILLDNAASTAQVQPLLPGTSGCLVLITSRNRMMGLDDAHFFALDALLPAEAIALLRMVAGESRIAADDPAARELVELCGLVPLAVRIVASRLRHQRGASTAGLVAELRAEPDRMMEGLRDDERNLAAVFESSYRALAGPEARLFRLLGLLPGADLDAYAAANLLGAPAAEAQLLLDALLDRNLVAEHAPGRYRMHDLLRAFARGLGGATEGERAALDRLLDYYEFTAQVSADRLARRVRPPSAIRAGAPAVVRELGDDEESVAWISAERGNLLAFLEQVTEPRRVVSLTAALTAFLTDEVPKNRQLALHEAAVAAADEAGRGAEQAEALLNLAHVYRIDGNFDHAMELLGAAVDAYRGIGDTLGEANALVELGRVVNLRGKHSDASEIHERALGRYRALGDRLGEADALYELARVDALVGEAARAESRAGEALTAFRELGKTLGVAQVRVVLANLRRRAGDFAAAAELLEQSAAVFREVGQKQNESNVLWTLGQIRLSQGDLEQSAVLLERALGLAREVGTRHGVAGCLGVLGTVRLAQGDLPAAAELLREALAMFEAIGHRTGAASAQMYLAKAKHLSGEPEAALDLLDAAIAAYEHAGDSAALAEAWILMGALVGDTADAEAALAWYHRALTRAREVDAAALQAEALEGVARCLAETDRGQAVESQREAVAIHRRLSVPALATAEAYLTELEG